MPPTAKCAACSPARRAGDKFPVVVVIHENRGLTPHIEDIARRLAVSGYMAFAADALWPLGGYPRRISTALKPTKKPLRCSGNSMTGNTSKTSSRRRSFCSSIRSPPGKLGAVGFCNGGAKVNQLAVRLPELAAAVPFYGRAPATADVPKIKAAVLAHFADAELDPNTTGTWPAYEAALKANGIKHEGYIYAKDLPRLSQRHDAAIRRSRRQACLAAHPRSL